MITKWEDIPGVKKVYYGSMSSGPTLIFRDDSFAVVSAVRYQDEEVCPKLAGVDDEDALYDAVQAGAAGAQVLLDAARAKFKKDFEEQERGRLAYLQKKYGGVK